MAAGLTFGIGALFLLIGLALGRRTARLARRGIRVQATVVAFESVGEDGSAPVVEFDHPTGGRRRVTVKGTSSPHPPIGGTLPVVIDPDDPSLVAGSSFEQLWLFPIAFTAMGGIAVLVSIVLLLKMKDGSGS